MKSSAAASRSQITVVNGTRQAIWVAIYKRPPLRPSEPPIAWQVVSPPPRGKTAVSIPRDYQICARYSFEPENPWRPVYQTNTLQVPHAPAGAAFVIEGVSPDRRTWGAVLTRAAERPEPYQIRVVNHFPIGVWSHVRQEGRDVFPPRILPPTAAWIEDLDTSFYVAVLPLPHVAGDLLPNSEIALTETAVKPGEWVKVQGGPRKGFEIARIPEGDSNLVDVIDEPDVRFSEPTARTTEKKPAVKRKAPKKPASRQRESKKTRKASSSL